jgi:hypothetical protein
MDAPKFDTLDIPIDIQVSIDDKNNFHIFHDLNNNTFFRIINDNNSLKRIQCTHDGAIIKNSIIYEDIICNINDYLWKISSEKYSLRYTKLEIIERIRNIDDNLQLKRLLDFLKNNFSTNIYDNCID